MTRAVITPNVATNKAVLSSEVALAGKPLVKTPEYWINVIRNIETSAYQASLKVATVE